MHLHFSFGQGAVLFAVGCGNGAASPGAVSDGATALVIDAPAVLRDVLAQGGDAGPTDAPAPAKDASVFDPFDDPASRITSTRGRVTRRRASAPPPCDSAPWAARASA